MSTPPSGPSGLLGDLQEVVGPAHLLTGEDLLASYTTDWTGRYSGTALAVLRPVDAAEVAGVLEVAARHGAAVVPQGGNTGLVGGSVPRARLAGGRPQLVLSTRRLTGGLELDRSSRLLEAGAGTTLAEAARAARHAGLHPGIDLAARESATLGGMVATNAGGLQAVRYGPMRARLAGVEAVLADGTVAARLSGLAKDSVGWDLGALLSGSEGTLAVVTRVALRLEATPVHRVAALVALDEVSSAVELVTGTLRRLASLEAAELTLEAGMSLVCETAGLAPPPGAGRAGAWLTVEAAADDDPTDELARALADPRVLETAVAGDAAGRGRLWAYRERHTEAVSRLGIPHKLDVSVRPGRLAALLARLPDEVEKRAPGARIVVFGHLAEGNLHVNVLGPPLEDDAADDAVLRLVLELGGSISAEHGVGVAKTPWLRLARSAAELEVMRRVRAALDPGGVLNPGVLEPT